MPDPRNTRVLLSFGAAKGGFELALQLQRDIYNKFGRALEGDSYFCYLDAETLRYTNGTKYTYIADRDLNVMSNKDWRKNYEQATKSCRTMVLLVTSQWLRSVWCWDELGILESAVLQNKSKTVIVAMWPDAESLLKLREFSERSKDGQKHTGEELRRRLKTIGQHAKNVYVRSPAGAFDPTLAGKIAGGGTNLFAYSLSKAETDLILSLIEQ